MHPSSHAMAPLVGYPSAPCNVKTVAPLASCIRHVPASPRQSPVQGYRLLESPSHGALSNNSPSQGYRLLESPSHGALSHNSPSPVHRAIEKHAPVYGTPTPVRANRPPMVPVDRQPMLPAPIPRESSTCSIDSVLAVMGKQVDYWSNSFGCWMPATISCVDVERGMVELDVKAGIWINAEASHLRPRTRPSQTQLEHMRNILHEEKLQQEALRIFNAYAVTADDLSEPGLVESSAINLGLEVDRLFGVVGSTIWVKQHIDRSPDKALVLDTFTSLFCRKLWAVYNEYGQAVNPEFSAPHRSGNPQDAYTFEKKLGEGTYGAVFLARQFGSHSRRAVKKIQKQASSMANSELEQEIGHLCALDHPHIIKLYEYFETVDYVYLVMDFCPGGDLQEFVNKAKNRRCYLNEDFVRTVSKQILKAIAHVHVRGSMHLDLKCGNVMLTPSRGTLPPARVESDCANPCGTGLPHAMLIDLGLARIFRAGHLGEPCGTPTTMAPEVWRGELTPKADVFSLGVMLFEMLANELPFKNIPCSVSEGQVYWGHTGKARFSEPSWTKLAHASGQGRVLCRDMMVFSRQRRPTASECLHAPFFCMHDAELALRTQSVVPTNLIEDLSPAIVGRLSNARSRNALKRSVSLSIARRWPSNQLPSIKRAFEALDADGTGRLRKDRVIASLVEVGVDSNVGREIVEAMDLDRNGLIGWTEFVSSCIDLADKSIEKDLRQLFNNADQDGDGLLSASDVGSLLIVEHLSKGDAARDAVDGIIDHSNASAVIDWKQFREYFQNRTSRKGNAKPNEKHLAHIGNVVTFDQFQQMMGELWQWALGSLQSKTLSRNQ